MAHRLTRTIGAIPLVLLLVAVASTAWVDERPCPPNQTLEHNRAAVEALHGTDQFGRVVVKVETIKAGKRLIGVAERKPTAIVGLFTHDECFVGVAHWPADAAAERFFDGKTRALLFPATLSL